METRKITIVATREQKKYVIDSAATTLGELKADLDNVGINYDDMTFMEGLTRTEILRDDSLLPHDVERVNRETGEPYVTNELVFMLTNTAKKIRSGVVCADRRSCYSYIKEHGMQDAVQRTFGKNFTQVKTEDLILFIKNETPAPSVPVEEPDENLVAPTQVPAPEHTECVDPKARKAIKMLCEALFEYDEYTFNGVVSEINDMFAEQHCLCTSKEDECNSPYSDSEINDMFAGLK